MKKLYKYLLNTLPRPLLIRLSYPFKLVAPLLFRGDKVECPVCENHFSKFLSYGSDKAHRENVLCPYDLTLERHRLMWLYLLKKSDFFTKEGLRVLHIAPEQCFHSRFKKQSNIAYLTGDLVSPLADLHFDLHDIPLEDDRFDVVFCNHVSVEQNSHATVAGTVCREPDGSGDVVVSGDARDVSVGVIPAANGVALRGKWNVSKRVVRD